MRRVIVSGGTRGIGFACVRAFCEAGDRVAFIYKSSAEIAERIEKEYGAHGICADVSCEEDVCRAISEAVGFLGGVDVLVNNAGISEIGLFTDMSGVDFRRVIDTNLSSVFYASREVAKYMIGQKSGRIINIGSVWGRCGASCEVAYSASKAGVRGLTLSMAKELGPSGITVNCIEPGVIATDMISNIDSQIIAELCDETPMCRIGTPEDVAGAVMFLASDKAGFITGQNIGVDGGFGL